MTGNSKFISEGRCQLWPSAASPSDSSALAVTWRGWLGPWLGLGPTFPQGGTHVGFTVAASVGPLLVTQAPTQLGRPRRP